MNHHDDPLTDPIDAWLDAFVAETSTTALEPAADPDLAALRATARQFHGLASVGGQYAASISSLPNTWEDVMHAPSAAAAVSPHTDTRRAAALVSARATPFGRTPQTVIPSLRGSSPSRPLRTFSLNTAVNAVLAAALIFALAAGVWRVAERYHPGSGGPDEPAPLQFAAFMNQGQDDFFELAPVPDPSECTVEPLTVDEVMARFQGPQSYGPRPGTPGPSTPTVSQRENGDLRYNGPDQGIVDEIEAAHRQWLACHLAGDLFRAWALEATSMVQATIFGIYGPQFSPETLRSDLERFAAGDTDTPFQTIAAAPDAYVPMVVTTGWDTVYPESHDAKVLIPLYWTTLDGTVAAVPGYLTQSQYNDPVFEMLRESPNLPNQATYIYDASVEQWLLLSFQLGGRG